MLCLVTLSCPTLCDLIGSSPPDSSVHGDSPHKTTGVGCHACPHPWDLPNPGIKPKAPALQVDSLPTEPPGKPHGETKKKKKKKNQTGKKYRLFKKASALVISHRSVVLSHFLSLPSPGESSERIEGEGCTENKLLLWNTTLLIQSC